MKILLFIIQFYCLNVFGNNQISDYIQVTEAHTTLQQLKQQTDKFKHLIDANFTTDFAQCTEQLKVNQCGFVDEWQNEIEKCKLENENSVKVELPFIKERKNKKVQRLKELIELGNQYDREMMILVEEMEGEQQDFERSSWEIHQMYKLPKDSDSAIEFVQKKSKEIDLVHALNSNIPKVAQNEVHTAQEAYNLGEISIQAQTVAEEMLSATKKLDHIMKGLEVAFKLRQEEISKEKEQLKKDIERLRVLKENEIRIQNQNLLKIQELEEKLTVCDQMPKNIIKDCAPLRVRTIKMQTEMSILEARTEFLFKEIEKLMKENQSQEEIQAQKDSVKALQEAALIRQEEESFLNDEEMMPMIEPPKELNPKHHLKQMVH